MDNGAEGTEAPHEYQKIPSDLSFSLSFTRDNPTAHSDSIYVKYDIAPDAHKYSPGISWDPQNSDWSICPERLYIRDIIIIFAFLLLSSQPFSGDEPCRPVDETVRRFCAIADWYLREYRKNSTLRRELISLQMSYP